MKSILISIKPKYVEKILNGEKTIEIRKTCPKCDLPIDVYIYCTEPYAKEVLSLFVPHIRPILGGRAGEFIERRIVDNPSMRWSICNGKVVAKFKLRFVEKIYPCGTDDLDTELGSSLEELSFQSCVPEKDLLSYVGNEAFCWIISCLEIFDEPKDLSEFGLAKAPQSWCYYMEEKE